MKTAHVILIILLALVGLISASAPCDPNNTPNNCGFYNSPDETGFCSENCTDATFDLCGICNGSAPIPSPTAFFPVTSVPTGAKMGGSVAIWNGSIAFSQHIIQTEYYPLPASPVPVITYNLNHATNTYSQFILPSASAPSLIGPALPDGIPPGRGFALIMDDSHLVVGSHDSAIRTVQLWVRSTSPPWAWLWSAADPCPGTFFGFSVAIDQNTPSGEYLPGTKVISTGNPAAFLSGRVFVYFTYSNAIAQVLQYQDDNYTTPICFGDSVSSDNGLLAVGAPKFSIGNDTYTGSVFIYRWNTSIGVQGGYELIVTIPPPVPETNGGFGLTVSVWNNTVFIGDNTQTIYEYTIVGNTAVPVLLQQPQFNGNSHLGADGITLWDNYFVAGDSVYVPPFYPAKSGVDFVYDRDPLDATIYRPMWDIIDPSSSVNTMFGFDVDNRGGCYLVSGVPNAPSRGGAYVHNLCRDTCYGCDGVLNSCAQPDLCGVCLGDNSTCVDCLGVYNGKAKEDSCGVCQGTNTTCVIPTFSLSMSGLNCNDVVVRNLTHLFQGQWGNAIWTLNTPLPTKGTAVLSYYTSGSTTIYILTYTVNPLTTGSDTIRLHAFIPNTGASGNFSISVNIATCVDCFGVVNGPARLDVCGVCDGLNNTCDGCDGVPASGLVYDACDVCGGDGRSCLNLTALVDYNVSCVRQIIFPIEVYPPGTPVHFSILVPPNSGDAYVNPNTGLTQWTNSEIYTEIVTFVIRGVSAYNSSVYFDLNVTFDVENCTDCNGIQGGFQIFDICGVCGGNGHTCIDCFGIPFGNATFDSCNVCGGDGSSCNGPITLAELLIVIIVALVGALLLFYFCFRVFCFGKTYIPGRLPKENRASGFVVPTLTTIQTNPTLSKPSAPMASQAPAIFNSNRFPGRFVVETPADKPYESEYIDTTR